MERLKLNTKIPPLHHTSNHVCVEPTFRENTRQLILFHVSQKIHTVIPIKSKLKY